MTETKPWLSAAKIKARRLAAEAEGARQAVVALQDEQFGLSREFTRLNARRLELLGISGAMCSLPANDPRREQVTNMLAAIVDELDALRAAMTDSRTRQEVVAVVSTAKGQLARRAEEIVHAIQGEVLTRTFGG